MAKKLSVKQRNESLKKLNGWKKTRGKDSIEKDFIFNDFHIASRSATRSSIHFSISSDTHATALGPSLIGAGKVPSAIFS